MGPRLYEALAAGGRHEDALGVKPLEEMLRTQGKVSAPGSDRATGAVATVVRADIAANLDVLAGARRHDALATYLAHLLEGDGSPAALVALRAHFGQRPDAALVLEEVVDARAARK